MGIKGIKARKKMVYSLGMNKKLAGTLRYLVPSAVTALIYCVILAVKGIYPFGNNTIDYYDMAQQIAAFYYHVYDALHGTKGMFYDWYSALGTNMAMSTSGCSDLSPFNLFFLFVSRDALLKSLSVFNGLKLMCMSATMYFYLTKTHREAPEFVRLMTSVGYSFCGFVLVLYITNQWVEIAVFFPLIMYFTDKLLKEGKMAGYVITMAITIICSYYLGFMILIFIFLYTGLNMLRSVLKDKKIGDNHLIQLGLGTLLSLALSSFIVIPQLTQMLASARFKNGNESELSGPIGRYISIISHVKGDYTTRWWSLLGISFAVAIIITGMIRFRKEYKELLMALSLILLMVLELFFESINLIWHFGSYIQYPIRNGFIIYFVFAHLACFYAGKLMASGYADEVSGEEKSAGDASGEDISSPEASSDISYEEMPAASEPDKAASDEKATVEKSSVRRQKVSAILGKWYTSFAVTLIGFIIFVVFYKANPGMELRSVFHITSAIMAVTFVFYFLLLNFGPVKKLGIRWASGIIVLEILIYGFLLFGKPDFITGYAEEPEQNGDYIFVCEQLRTAFKLEPEYLYRVKNPDETLNANYGFVLARPALSNWTHMIAPGEQSGAADWGYSVQFTRLLDAGGTVFSDALIGVRDVISCVPMDERLYEEIDRAVVKVSQNSDETVEYVRYRPVYTLPFGVNVAGTDEDIKDGADTVTLHNRIYRSMMKALGAGGDAGELATLYVSGDGAADDSAVTDVRTLKEVKETEASIDIKGEQALYLLGDCVDTEYKNCSIEVTCDGETQAIGIPSIREPDNTMYPAHFNNNAVYLGSFKDKTVIVRITMDKSVGEYFRVDIMGISLDAMDGLCAAYSDVKDERISASHASLDIDIAAGEGDGLLLPVTYDKGWKVKINGKRVKPYTYAGLFTMIPLNAGDNIISMKFTPPGMRFGIFVTAAAILISAGCVFAGVFFKDRTGTRIEGLQATVTPVLNKIYLAAFAIAMLFMYIIPVVYGIISTVF